MYALFGAHIAHVILNWEEDKMMFRGTCILNMSGQNILKPIPKRYALKFRLVRMLILIVWVIAEGSLGFYHKVIKCNFENWKGEVDTNRLEYMQHIMGIEPKVTGLCYTPASYSAHFFGFITGLFFGLVVLKRRRIITYAVKVIFKTSILVMFLILIITLVYVNNENNGDLNSRGSKCSLEDYVKMCQAKCYCGMNNTELERESFFPSCQNTSIPCRHIGKSHPAICAT